MDRSKSPAPARPSAVSTFPTKRKQPIPAQWLEIKVRVAPELVEPAAHLFERYGKGAAIETSPDDPLATLRTYISPRAHRALAQIEIGLRLMALIQPVEGPEVRPLARDDWANAWKAHFSVLHVGRRTVIKPSWLEYKPKKNDIVVELDPGMAFGTGHHPSTRLCLEAVEDLVQPGMRVLDVGTGSGVLSISAMRFGADSVVALDVDGDAVRTARENLRHNGIGRAVRVAKGSVPNALVPEGSFDIALANISARVIAELASHLAAALRPGGLLVGAGIIESQQDIVDQALAANSLTVERRLQEQDWVAVLARKA